MCMYLYKNNVHVCIQYASFSHKGAPDFNVFVIRDIGHSKAILHRYYEMYSRISQTQTQANKIPTH